MTWRGIRAFRLVTPDLDRAAAFYAALGFDLEARRPIGSDEIEMLGLGGTGMRQTMRLGSSRVDLDAFEPAGRAYPVDADAASPCFQHLALVTDDAGTAWRRAQRAGARAISRHGPVTLPPAAGGVTAVKFRDPDGHPLELLRFREHRDGRGQGLLGVDHSAITVTDVPMSLRFYEARGLRSDRPTLNHGPTQEDLDGLEAVVVDVVPLRPETITPHLELLGYRQPKGPACGPVAADDVAATRVVWSAPRAALVRDPDGHCHQLERD